jgi:hypothetical protein
LSGFSHFLTHLPVFDEGFHRLLFFPTAFDLRFPIKK